MSRRLLALPLVLLAVPATATASTALDTRLATSGATTAPCHEALLRGPGVVTKPVYAPGPGQLHIALNGAAGDWDVALFAQDGHAVAAGASPDAHEVATGYTLKAAALTLQACRRSGPTSAPATVEFTPSSAETTAAPQFVSVSTPTRDAKDRLVALDLDLSEHGGTDAVGVVLHGPGDAQTLKDAGFSYRVLGRDMTDLAPAAATTLPSGRTSYRTLADYESELKQLAAGNPGLVRLFTLPEKTFGKHDVMGIEIAENVAANDGRPAFLNMGVHHAREWPAGELTMEWAYELIKGYKAGDARATNIVTHSRNIVVPIVNPDGFEASRNAGMADGRDETNPDEVYIATSPGEYRRKNCRAADGSEVAVCPVSAGLAENGVDINRNYGQFWGGPGSDTNPATQTYHGTAPFSEPETRNIQWLVSHNQVMTLITNHTTAGLVLRAPGLAAVGDPVDEDRGYKALGDAMAAENGYFSQKGFELYDTTGTTEDWSYNATGGFGFTFELYCGAPNYDTGDCDKPSFHPRYATMAKEWDGTSAQADHGRDGKGNREAYYLAAESTINEARHSIIEGTAPPGTRLTLTKQFKTDSYDGTIKTDDKLETTFDVGPSGSFRWHVNPSTRPIVAKATGSPNAGPPSPPQSAHGSVATAPPGAFNDHAFTVPPGDNASADFLVKWTTPVSDWDIELFRDTNGNGHVDGGEPSVGSSAQGATDSEQVTAANPSGAYVLRVSNYAALEDYDVTVTYHAPAPYKAAQTEAYTLSCGASTQQVVVERGQTAHADCPAAAKTTTTTTRAPNSPLTCAATAGLSSATVKPAGRGLRIERGAATVSILKNGRRVTTNPAKLKDGYYVVVFTLGPNTRRVALRRAHGRFSLAPAFERRSCDLVPSFELSGPTFAKTLGISYRTARRTQVTITITRAGKVVKRFPARAAEGTVRLRYRPSRPGVYRVKLVAETVSSTLASRRT